MRKLSNFLAGFLMEGAILSDDDMRNDVQEQIAEQIAEGIERYKKHLKMDTPRTAGWVMREKEMITALDRMEAEAHADLIDTNPPGDEPCGFAICQNPEFRMHIGCESCTIPNYKKDDAKHGKSK